MFTVHLISLKWTNQHQYNTNGWNKKYVQNVDGEICYEIIETTGTRLCPTVEAGISNVFYWWPW